MIYLRYGSDMLCWARSCMLRAGATLTFLARVYPPLFSPKLVFHRSEERVHVSMDILEASRERKRALTAELADVHRAAKRVRKREATRRSASARVWLVEGVKLNIVLAIYVLADCRHEPAVSYFRRMGRQHRWLQNSDTELIVLVEDLFLAADINQLASLSNVDHHDGSHVLRAATDYVWQWRLASWTAQQNDKGITPPTSLVLDQWAKNRIADLRPPYLDSTAFASARMRALRWRRKFGGRIGAIRVRQHTPVDVMQSKVSSMKMVHANARQRSHIDHIVPID